jgi:hypothetical protein
MNEMHDLKYNETRLIDIEINAHFRSYNLIICETRQPALGLLGWNSHIQIRFYRKFIYLLGARRKNQGYENCKIFGGFELLLAINK